MIRNIILDFGGVLYEIDFQETQDAFNALSHIALKQPIIFSLLQQNSIFDVFEVGANAPSDFYASLKDVLQSPNVSEKDLKTCWNLMLKGCFPYSWDWVNFLRGKYNIVLLSNTNIIHFQYFEQECSQLFRCFQNLFFSFQLGLRKPDRAIFSHVLETMKWTPSQTMLIDDAPQNIAVANDMGLKTWLFDSKEFTTTSNLCDKIKELTAGENSNDFPLRIPT